jgi:hypothetical protein
MSENKKPDPARSDVAIDAEGRLLPMSAEKVRAMVEDMIDKGDLLAVVVQMPDGDMGVQVFGPPSRKLLDVFETATAAMRQALALARRATRN